MVGGNDLSLYEFNEIQEKVHEMVSQDAQIIVGFTEDVSLDEALSITVIATGFKAKSKTAEDPAAGKKNELPGRAASALSPFNRRNIDQEESTQVDSSGGMKFPQISADSDNFEVPAYLRKKHSG